VVCADGCPSCRSTFDALKDSLESERAARLDELQPRCCCQSHSVSRHSVGIVGATEVLIRLLVAPYHMNKRKLPRAAALSAAENIGLSVFRENQATDAEIRNIAEGLVRRARDSQGDKGDKAGIFGALMMPCASIRESKADDEIDPAYCVYDTALEHIPSHAEAFQRVRAADEALREARRLALFTSVQSGFVSVENFRKGLLSDLAPKL
jgi:hypothetical protein